jgi:hypothetical protein
MIIYVGVQNLPRNKPICWSNSKQHSHRDEKRDPTHTGDPEVITSAVLVPVPADLSNVLGRSDLVLDTVLPVGAGDCTVTCRPLLCTGPL